jgi:hypothetical protein
MSYLESFVRVRLSLKTQLTLKESDLERAESYLKFASKKEKEKLNEKDSYGYGYWYGTRCSTEDNIRSLNYEIDRLKNDLKEVEESGSLPVTV